MRRAVRYGSLCAFLALLTGCAISTYQVTDEELRPLVARYEGAEVCSSWRMGSVETKAFHKTRGLQPDAMGEIPVGTRVRVGKVVSKPKGKWERHFWFVVKPEGYEEWQYVIAVSKDVESLFQPCEGILGHLAAGNALRRQGKLDEAAAAYRQVEGGEDRYQLAAAYALGDIYRAQGALEEAMREFEGVVKMDPFHADAHAALAALYAELGLHDKAEEEQRAEVAAYTTLAQEYLRRGRAGDAQRTSERAISSDRQGNAGPYIILGRAYLQQRRRDEAIATFEKALDLSPGNPYALLNLAMVYEHGAPGVRYGPGMDVERALEYYERLLERSPLFADAHYNLGRLCLRTGRFADAMTALDRAIQLDPGNALAHYELAMAAFQLGDYPLAWREARISEQFIEGSNPLASKLAEVSEEPPEAGRFAEMYRHYVLGLRAVRRNEADEAIAELMQAISVGPPFAPVHAVLALAYGKQSKLEMAKAELEQAVEIDPADADALASLAALYHDTGRRDEALALLERAAALDPAVAKTHRYLSLIYEESGRKEEAERERAIYRRLTGR